MKNHYFNSKYLYRITPANKHSNNLYNLVRIRLGRKSEPTYRFLNLMGLEIEGLLKDVIELDDYSAQGIILGIFEDDPLF